MPVSTQQNTLDNCSDQLTGHKLASSVNVAVTANSNWLAEAIMVQASQCLQHKGQLKGHTVWSTTGKATGLVYGIGSANTGLTAWIN